MKSTKKQKIIAFIDRLEKDRNDNFKKLSDKAKLLRLEGFESIFWDDMIWKVTAGRLTKSTGRNTQSVLFHFQYSKSLESQEMPEEWANLAKVLFILRFHRKHQVASNQRLFIVALGYIAYAAELLHQKLQTLTLEALDLACKTISEHYSDGAAYNLHKAVNEIAGHCDANGLCRIVFKYKYSKMRRPNKTGGLAYVRLDDPKARETQGEKIIKPIVFKILGEIYQNMPKNHKYRCYILLLTLLACLGRRFNEIALLPYQKIQTDSDGNKYIEYFPRKTSQGDILTPKRKLYMPTEVLPIVTEVLIEVDELCYSARKTAQEMHQNQSVDVRFLDKINENKKLYKFDLKKLGIPPTILDSTGWLRVNGFAFKETDKLTQEGKLASRVPVYTFKSGIIAYCQKDYLQQYVEAIHIDQFGKTYYLKDLLFIRHLGLSSGAYSHWLATSCTHSMLTTFMRYFSDIAKEYASSSIDVDFTSHHFRHTLNTLLDEGGLSDLLQTEWFGRSNPKDTKSYQHTSREKRALMLREEIKKGNVGGELAEQIQRIAIHVQDAVLKARVQAVHDVGAGICIHNFSQTPCERHLQCSASCRDYVWIKDDKLRIEEQKRQLALTKLARETAQEKLKTKKPKKSSDWLVHNEKKIKTLEKQLQDNAVSDFDHNEYIKELINE